ncbi:MAG: type IV pilin protein [Xanthomonadales bacterium]|nr:type IV pilin protein [Xanthomonadales bacterium]
MTILELVVVIAAIAILVSLAIPSYRDYMIRVHRTEAVSILLGIGSCQEQLFSTTGRFDTGACLAAEPDHYEIRMDPPDNANTLSFTAWADPIGAQERDRCGSLGLDQTGLRRVSGEGADVGKCWAAR